MDNHNQIMQALGRIEQKIDSHLEDDDRVHDRQDGAISDLTTASQNNRAAIAKVRGVGAGVSGLFVIVLAALGLDKFGG